MFMTKTLSLNATAIESYNQAMKQRRKHAPYWSLNLHSAVFHSSLCFLSIYLLKNINTNHMHENSNKITSS